MNGASALRPPMVVSLGDARARSVDLAGGKAAALARAEGAGLATLGGLVLSTEFCADVDAGTPVEGHPVVAEAFRRAGGDDRSLVARSSSVVEDAATSSMAGQFASVIGVDGLDEFTAAVRTVLDSRVTAGAPDEPIAVLVQPLIEPPSAGSCSGSIPSPDAAIGGSCRPSAAGPSRSSAVWSRARGPCSTPAGRSCRRPRATVPTCRRATSAGWLRWRTRSPRSSAARRTSSGRSARTASCGCCSRGPSRPRSAASRRAPSTGRARWPRRSPNR